MKCEILIQILDTPQEDRKELQQLVEPLLQIVNDQRTLQYNRDEERSKNGALSQEHWKQYVEQFSSLRFSDYLIWKCLKKIDREQRVAIVENTLSLCALAVDEYIFMASMKGRDNLPPKYWPITIKTKISSQIAMLNIIAKLPPDDRDSICCLAKLLHNIEDTTQDRADNIRYLLEKQQKAKNLSQYKERREIIIDYIKNSSISSDSRWLLLGISDEITDTNSLIKVFDSTQKWLGKTDWFRFMKENHAGCLFKNNGFQEGYFQVLDQVTFQLPWITLDTAARFFPMLPSLRESILKFIQGLHHFGDQEKQQCLNWVMTLNSDGMITYLKLLQVASAHMAPLHKNPKDFLSYAKQNSSVVFDVIIKIFNIVKKPIENKFISFLFYSQQPEKYFKFIEIAYISGEAEKFVSQYNNLSLPAFHAKLEEWYQAQNKSIQR